MGPPGGGRMVISPRIQSRFNLINMTFPHVSNQIYKILIKVKILSTLISLQQILILLTTYQVS